MFFFSLVIAVLAVLLEGTIALKCYECGERDKRCQVTECTNDLDLGEQFCFSLSRDGYKEDRSCADENLLKLYEWSGDCISDFLLREYRGCRCKEDLCNADCGCGMPRYKQMMSDPATKVPPERATNLLRCRNTKYGNDEEEEPHTCSKEEVACFAKIVEWKGDTDNTKEITRGCTILYPAFNDDWGELDCSTHENDRYIMYGCRCYTDMCNDDCKCGVPDYTGPGSTAGGRLPDDPNNDQHRSPDDQHRSPNEAYSNTNMNWNVCILMAQWCFMRLF